MQLDAGQADDICEGQVRMVTVAKSMNELQAQIDEKRKEIHSDQYSMSIGELANMYKDGELDVHPEFQRFFRWSPEQKSRFVESIFLGIPIPSIFVAQREDGKWDVIDGLQRLSTIFQLMGVLKDESGKFIEPLELTRTRYLPAMEGKSWNGTNRRHQLSQAQQLLLKRAKLDIKIVLRESDESAKFELFQRLNTGGSPLSDQEIRNAMLVAAKKPFFDWLRQMADFPQFKNCIPLSEQAISERFDMELVLRFITLRKQSDDKLRGLGDIGDYLTDTMMELAGSFPKFIESEKLAFQRTFEALDATLGDNSFRKYDPSKDRFAGAFLISAFESVALGIGFHADRAAKPRWIDLSDRVKKLWSDADFLTSVGAGIRASQRIPRTVGLGRVLFKP